MFETPTSGNPSSRGTTSRLARRVLGSAIGVVIASAGFVPVAAPAAAAPAGCVVTGSGAVCNYYADTTFTVPTGVTSMSIEAIGGSGAPGATLIGYTPAGPGGQPDDVVLNNYAATAGSTLNVYIGGNGASPVGGNGFGGVGGAHGGGNGGYYSDSYSAAGGGGGGASSVQLNGTVIVEAAGGGGGGGGLNSPNGQGGPGGAAGQNGGDPTGYIINNDPGQHEYGGAGTAAGPGQGNGGSGAGAASFGGTAIQGGGGGGSGYYGGGGGGFAGGGGGGYSFGYSTKTLAPLNTRPSVRITYTLAPPTITGFSPTSGPTSGGTVVTITGTNFPTGPGQLYGVKFGTVAATDVHVISSTELQATTPEGTGDVAITISGESGFVTSAAKFSYTGLPAPTTVSSCTPTSGPPSGGTFVTVTGTGFTNVNTVKFGNTPGTGLIIASPTELEVTSPPGTGSVPVTINSNTQTVSCPTNFTYGDGGSTGGAPTISGFTPASGPAGGGTVVTLTGTNFAAGATVAFGTSPGTAVTVTSPTQLQVTSPAGTGSVPISVTVNGQTATSAASFTYTGQAQDPTIEAVVDSPSPKTNGWYRAPVTVAFRCAAGSAPLAESCPASITLSKNGSDQSATGTITDTDGHSATTTVSGINIDRVKPSLTVTGATDGATYGTSRHLACHAEDTLSGVASCTITHSRHVRGAVTTVTWTAAATDEAGNTTTQRGSYHIRSRH